MRSGADGAVHGAQCQLGARGRAAALLLDPCVVRFAVSNGSLTYADVPGRASRALLQEPLEAASLANAGQLSSQQGTGATAAALAVTAPDKPEVYQQILAV